MIGDTRRHRRSDPQSLMNPAEVIKHHVHGNRVNDAFLPVSLA